MFHKQYYLNTYNIIELKKKMIKLKIVLKSYFFSITKFGFWGRISVKVEPNPNPSLSAVNSELIK